MRKEERIQYTSDFFLRKCSDVLGEFGDVMPHELVARRPIGEGSLPQDRV